MKRELLDLPPAPLSVYRRSCVAMLRRYFRMSIELGRLPAILGREYFPARCDTIPRAWFEDAVIYVHDIERCLEELKHFDRQVIVRVIFQEHTHEDAARLLECTDRNIRKRLAIALDVLSQLFLDRKLLRVVEPLPQHQETVERISAAEEIFAGFPVSTYVAPREDPWREVPVEICCQPPSASQIPATY